MKKIITHVTFIGAVFLVFLSLFWFDNYIFESTIKDFDFAIVNYILPFAGLLIGCLIAFVMFKWFKLSDKNYAAAIILAGTFLGLAMFFNFDIIASFNGSLKLSTVTIITMAVQSVMMLSAFISVGYYIMTNILTKRFSLDVLISAGVTVAVSLCVVLIAPFNELAFMVLVIMLAVILITAGILAESFESKFPIGKDKKQIN